MGYIRIWRQLTFPFPYNESYKQIISICIKLSDTGRLNVFRKQSSEADLGEHVFCIFKFVTQMEIKENAKWLDIKAYKSKLIHQLIECFFADGQIMVKGTEGEF